jgi:hypothetical protein
MPIPKRFEPKVENFDTGDLAATQPLKRLEPQGPLAGGGPLEGADSTRPTVVGMSLTELETQMAASAAEESLGTGGQNSTSPEGSSSDWGTADASQGEVAKNTESNWEAGLESDAADHSASKLDEPAWTDLQSGANQATGLDSSADWSMNRASRKPVDFEDEPRHGPRTTGGMAFVVTGIFLMLGSGAYGLLGTGTSDANFSMGKAHHALVDGLVRVTLPVNSAEPVNIIHPGGRRSINGDGELRFAMDAKKIQLGVRPITIRVDHAGTQIPVTGEFNALYALRIVSADDNQMELQLDLAEKWNVTADPGRLERLAGNSYRWIVSRGNKDGTSTPLSGKLTVHHQNGNRHVMEQPLRFPSLSTPLRVLNPMDGTRTVNPRIEVSGLTFPFAQVQVDSQTITADEEGRFKTIVQGSHGQGSITVQSTVPGRRPTTANVKFFILDKKAYRLGVVTLRRQIAEFRQAYGPAPTYEQLQDGYEEPMVIQGQLVSHHRTGPGSRALLISVCRNESRCPVWVDHTGNDYSIVGKRVAIAGRLIGKKSYHGQDGVLREIPRLDAQVVTP